MREFQLIRQIQQQLSRAGDLSSHGIKVGMGDDAAILEVPSGRHLVACTDTLIAGTHFPVATLPFDIGHKCLAVNLSDLAAMGAEPHWVLLGLTMPRPDQEWLQAFTAGFSALAEAHDVTLVGGDTSAGPLSVTVTALGSIEPGRSLLRSGARPGDLIVISGTLGGAARVLDLLKAGLALSEQYLLDRPQPRVALGRAISGFASACIDVSDGLLTDLGHILEASGCGAHLQTGKLPASKLLDPLEVQQKWNYQLSGGDDYELLFSLPSDHVTRIANWSKDLDINLNIIGTVVQGAGVHCFAPDGGEFRPSGAGFEHFGQAM